LPGQTLLAAILNMQMSKSPIISGYEKCFNNLALQSLDCKSDEGYFESDEGYLESDEGYFESDEGYF
jgi:hypothetical protein